MTLPSRKQDNVLIFRKKSLLFEIENHQELFALGRTFLPDISKGVQSFGFSSLGYEMSQKRTVLGLACFINYKNLGKVAIVSDSFENNIFSNLVQHSRVKSVDVGGAENCEIHDFADSFDLIEMSTLLQTKSLERMHGLEGILQNYDLVLWDLPPWYKLQKSSQVYLSIISCVESLSIVVAPSLSKNEEIKRAKKFFGDYGISLKGFVLDNRGDEEQISELKGA